MSRDTRNILVVAAIVFGVWMLFVRGKGTRNGFTQSEAWPSEVNREVQH